VEGSLRPPEGTIALLFTDVEGSTSTRSRLADAQALDVARPTAGSDENPLGPHRAIAEAAQRLGAAATAGLRSRGRAVPAGSRVTVACQIARAACRADATPTATGGGRPSV
jgi:hypothetical protein